MIASVSGHGAKASMFHDLHVWSHLPQDLETARAEVAQLLQAQPADLAHLGASVAAQTAHVQNLRSASQEAARRLQVVRADKDRLLCALGRRGAATTAAGNGA